MKRTIAALILGAISLTCGYAVRYAPDGKAHYNGHQPAYVLGEAPPPPKAPADKPPDCLPTQCGCNIYHPWDCVP